MKNLFFAISLIMLIGCGGIKTSSSGLDKESYLEFIGNPHNYSGGVNVSVDNNPIYNAEVFNDKASRTKGKVYAISTGQHIISVTYKNNIIFTKQIFLSTQETKKILLP